MTKAGGRETSMRYGVKTPHEIHLKVVKNSGHCSIQLAVKCMSALLKRHILRALDFEQTGAFWSIHCFRV